jgi:SAM-dependent methyltransferase
VSATTDQDRVASARRAVAANEHWYHTLELAPGLLTPGHIDLRAVAPKVLPGAAELSGSRALDVGTFDGFWAFELERRGAEVVALDIPAVSAAELPPVQRRRLEQASSELDIVLGRGFALAAEALGSGVRRVEATVYDLTPELIGGPVRFVFAGAILLHLRDPVRALERIRDVLEPGGRVTVLEPFSIRDTLASPRRAAATFRAAWSDFAWWVPNLAALRGWLQAAGFTQIEQRGLHHPPARPEMRQWLAGYTARNPGTP